MIPFIEQDIKINRGISQQRIYVSERGSTTCKGWNVLVLFKYFPKTNVVKIELEK